MLINFTLAAVVIAGPQAESPDIRDAVAVQPLASVASRASVGSDVYVKTTTTSQWGPIALLLKDLDLSVTSDKRLVVAATTPLIPDPLFTPPSFVACAAVGGLRTKKGEEQACFADSNNDGLFDRAGGSGSLYRKKVDPIAYRMDAVPVKVIKTFRQTLIYSGLDGKTLRLSYREFTDDMARPAFTQDLTFTMTGKYPESVLLRDVKINVLGADNDGLRYSVSSVAKLP